MHCDVRLTWVINCLKWNDLKPFVLSLEDLRKPLESQYPVNRLSHEIFEAHAGDKPENKIFESGLGPLP